MQPLFDSAFMEEKYGWVPKKVTNHDREVHRKNCLPPGKGVGGSV